MKENIPPVFLLLFGFVGLILIYNSTTSISAGKPWDSGTKVFIKSKVAHAPDLETHILDSEDLRISGDTLIFKNF